MSMQDLFTKTKVCGRCNLPKLLKEFGTHKNRIGTYIYNSYCNLCMGKSSNGYNLGAGRSKKNERSVKSSKYSKYGLSQAEYEELLHAQDFKCASCKKELQEKFVDHDHITGEVRGILCRRCNTIIGFADDDIQVLQDNINYLRRYQ